MKDQEQMVLFRTSILHRVYMQPLLAILMNYGMMMTSKFMDNMSRKLLSCFYFSPPYTHSMPMSELEQVFCAVQCLSIFSRYPATM